MADVKITVNTYEGYRAAERPRSFLIESEQAVSVIEIVRTWIEETKMTRDRKRFFQVRGSDGFLSTLYYDLEERTWFLRTRVKAKPEAC